MVESISKLVSIFDPLNLITCNQFNHDTVLITKWEINVIGDENAKIQKERSI